MYNESHEVKVKKHYSSEAEEHSSGNRSLLGIFHESKLK